MRPLYAGRSILVPGAIIHPLLNCLAEVMKYVDLERLKEVFYGAIEEAPDRRESFLAEACGNDEDLHAEVARLLSEHDEAGGFLESPFRNVFSARFPILSESPLEGNKIIAGRYRIAGVIGEGGMGVVYKAEDMRLPRLVALKSLGRRAIGDTASLARLQREAQAASTLNHPNICTIYDVIESEGRTFIVMEYLAGRTIREMIRSGCFSGVDTGTKRDSAPLILDDLMGIAIQIVEGLEAAHDRGIVHRDIKPANIFVTNMGLVKILDFGLAQTTPLPGNVMSTADATKIACSFEAHLTLTGVAAGTVGYMSPEQASARELDTRSDLFSFGTVLYEMATGAMPFTGDNTKLVVDSILNHPVVPAAQRNPSIPPRLSEIIEKCLQKDPDLRYQGAADIRSELRQLANQMGLRRGTEKLLPHGANDAASTAETDYFRRQGANFKQDLRAGKSAGLPPSLRWSFIAVGAIIISAGTMVFLFRPELQPPRITGSTQLTHDGLGKDRIVTDGSHIYYSSYPDLSARLYQVSATGGNAVQIKTSIPGPYVFDISPNHAELLVGGCKAGQPTSNCDLWTLPLRGSSPRRLDGISASDAAWSPDGKTVAYVKDSGLYELELATSESEKLVGMPAGYTVSWPRWSPDGTRLRFTVSTQSQGTSLWEVSNEGRNLHPLLSGWNTPPSECCGSWTPDGRYFVFQSDRGGDTNVWAIREGRSLLREVNHQPVQLTAGPTSAETPVPTPDNRKLLVITAWRGELVRYDAASRDFAPFLSGMSAIGVNFSSDGKWITYVAYPQHTLWRSKVDGSERLQLTFPPLYVLQPRWSSDGTRIAFAALEADKPWSIYVISANGGSLEQPVPGDHRGSDPNWSPDGSHLLFGRHPSEEAPGKGALDLEIVDLHSHVVTKVAGSEEMWSPRWSRDGRRILALPRTADRLLMFDVAKQKWTELAKTPVSYPEWSRDGNTIVFLARSKGAPATGIFRLRVSDHKLEQMASLRQLEQSPVDWGDWAGLAPDDSPILLREAGTPDIYALDWDAP
jgi:serine/threonine protein kinase/Tol biopolymer transport system component